MALPDRNNGMTFSLLLTAACKSARTRHGGSMRKQVTIVSLAGMALAIFALSAAKADEYGTTSRAKRHLVRHTHYSQIHYARCAERVVERVTGYRYYPRVMLYSFEPQEFTR